MRAIQGETRQGVWGQKGEDLSASSYTDILFPFPHLESTPLLGSDGFRLGFKISFW